MSAFSVFGRGKLFFWVSPIYGTIGYMLAAFQCVVRWSTKLDTLFKPFVVTRKPLLFRLCH